MPALHFPDPPLADDVVSLRAPTEADVPAWWRATQDPLVPKYTPVSPDQTQEDLHAFLAQRGPEREAGRSIVLVIADRATDELLGTVSLFNFDWNARRGEIGYLLGPWGRGRGAATHAVRLLSRWALETVGLARLELYADIENEPSQRVAERCRFAREGVLRSLEERRGRRHDFVLFSLLPSDLA